MQQLWWRGRPRPRVSKLLSFRATGRICFRDPLLDRAARSRGPAQAFRELSAWARAPARERSTYVVRWRPRVLEPLRQRGLSSRAQRGICSCKPPAPASCTAPPVRPARQASASQKVPQYTPHAWERPRAINLVPFLRQAQLHEPPVFLPSHSLHQPAPLQIPHHHRQIAAGFQDLARDFRQHHRPQVIERFHHGELARRQFPTGQVAGRKRMHGIAGTQQLHIGG